MSKRHNIRNKYKLSSIRSLLISSILNNNNNDNKNNNNNNNNNNNANMSVILLNSYPWTYAQLVYMETYLGIKWLLFLCLSSWFPLPRTEQLMVVNWDRPGYFVSIGNYFHYIVYFTHMSCTVLASWQPHSIPVCLQQPFTNVSSSF